MAKRLLSILPFVFMALAVVAVLSAALGHPFLPHSELLLGMAALPLAQQNTINTNLGVLKEFYSGHRLWDEIWENNAALALLNKEMDTCGAYYDFSVAIAGSQGYAVNFQNALANQTPEIYSNFHVPVSQMIGLATIQNKDLRAAAMKGPGAFEGILDGAVRRGIKNVTNEFARQMFGGGTATIGQITAVSAASGTITVTLASTLSYQFFEYAMKLNVTATDGGAPIATTPGTNDTATVTNIDASAGSLVINAGAFTTFTVGSYLIRDGNYTSIGFSGNISTQSGQSAYDPVLVAGLGLWCPSAASRAAGILNTSFCNVTRNLDGTRQAGIAVNATGISIQAGYIQGTRALHMFGHPGDYIAFTNPNTWAVLNESLQGQRLYQTEVTGEGPISFDALMVNGGMGKIKVVCDRNVPPFTTFMCRLDAMRMVSMGAPFELLEYPGMPGGYVWPLQDDDAVQIRFGGYPQLVVEDPTGIVNITTSQ